MARKNRFPEMYSVGFDGQYDSEVSGTSGQIDTGFVPSEDSTAPRRKWININSASRYGFDVPSDVFSLSRLSSDEKENLLLRLRSELVRIRGLLTKLERNRISAITVPSSSDILSCNNVQKSAHTQNLMKSSDITSGKKADLSVHQGLNRCNSGRYNSVNPGLASNPNPALLKECTNLLKRLLSHQFAWVFNKPVDVVALNIPDYFTVIKNPMDLGTVKSKLVSGQYTGPLDFLADIRLTFSNAMTYNPPGNNVHLWADTMSNFFEARCKAIEKCMIENSSQPLAERSWIHIGSEIIKPAITGEKRKFNPSQHLSKSEIVHQRKADEPVKLRMTEDEKRKLISELKPLLEDLPNSIVNFFREQTSNGAQAGEDEIEIDFDNLQDDALFLLRKLLDDHLQEKRRNGAKAEACEIELPHESGLSSSSLRMDKGNILDEDADIGDSEPPVSSNPPVDIQVAADSCRTRGSGSEAEALVSLMPMQPNSSSKDSHGRIGAHALYEEIESVSGCEQLEKSLVDKPVSDVSDDLQGGSAFAERQVSPDRLYRAAILKNRFADTILKAREKTLGQGEKIDPEKLRREREELEIQKKKERARLQAEAKAAEDAQRRAEAEAAAEVKRRRELEREAARQALLKIEKTVEMNESSRFLEDLEMLRAGVPEQIPCSDDEDELQQGDLGSFKFGSSNPLEQLGLYIKADEDDGEDNDEQVESPNRVADDEQVESPNRVADDEQVESPNGEQVGLLPPVLSERINEEDAEEGEID